MIEIVVHEHALKHDLSSREIEYAWRNFVVQQHKMCIRDSSVVVHVEGVLHRDRALVEHGACLLYTSRCV